LRAKTNFSYTRREILLILSREDEILICDDHDKNLDDYQPNIPQFEDQKNIHLDNNFHQSNRTSNDKEEKDSSEKNESFETPCNYDPPNSTRIPIRIIRSDPFLDSYKN
jgi:hypothetical protein